MPSSILISFYVIRLLTPPGTPLFPSSEGSESQPTLVAPRSSSLARSASTTKAASRLSVSQSESYHSSRPTRSSSVTRPSISSSQYISRQHHTHSKTFHTIQLPPDTITFLNSNSRASFQPPPALQLTRLDPLKIQDPQLQPPSYMPLASSPSTSAGRVLSNNRIPGPTSRPKFPKTLRVRPQQPVVPPDFPLEPHLQTSEPTLPLRQATFCRQVPGQIVLETMKGNPETVGSVIAPRRHSSPIVSHKSIKGEDSQSHLGKGGVLFPQRAPGFGWRELYLRSSLDMATSGIWSGSAPESINNGNLQNGDVLENESYFSRATEIRREANDGQRYSAKLSEVVDICESSRYDAILLKEDLKNTDWLHTVLMINLIRGPFFDNGFEPLPEPFGLL
ncbi:hypothetical protein NC653_037049 [Populus alba x Populus x berolinensis]|uniref:Uncharacterized protein n=1 Tax=Populus alba x Populus x berolinensis TaxID=444605 RepID=A0AAD6PVN3_9ROSI|nr:hypothetical protein NC653_037049 [Populus alba x Populus x berolinensis]